MRHYFGLCRRFEECYRKDITIHHINDVVKKFTSHRTVDSYGPVAQKLLDAKIISPKDFEGLCSCDTCEPGHLIFGCTMERCSTHGNPHLGDDHEPHLPYPVTTKRSKRGGKDVVADEDEDDEIDGTDLDGELVDLDIQDEEEVLE